MNNYIRLKKIFKRLADFDYIQRILQWDEAVMMPVGAGSARAEALATLNRVRHQKLISKKTKDLILSGQDVSELSAWDKVNFKWMEKKYKLAACIPAQLIERSTKAAVACEQAWRKYRAENNWQDFLPYLNNNFQLIKEITKRRAEVLNLDLYDALLDEYAPGFNQEFIDKIFAMLKNALPPLIKEIAHEQQKNNVIDPLGPFPIEQQKALGLRVMQALDFDFECGRLDISHHPFCSGGPTDVRITTRYTQAEFLSSLLAICHETGHGLYEQGLPKAWREQPVGQIHSMAMHESQSLLIEMEVCRSAEFYEFVLPYLREYFGHQNAFTPDNLHRVAIKVRPGLIRVDADEVTYPLHIILRYDIEKALFAGEMTIKDLPHHWHELMSKYLGLSTIKNDKDGVMQDVHWPAGLFGYFPAYTLGRLIAAQLYAKFNAEHSHFNQELKQGKFVTLHQWLNQNVYSYASSLTTNELLISSTGETLNPSYFIDRIKQRYVN